MNDIVEKAKKNWVWISIGVLVALSFFVAYEIIAAFGTAIIALFSGKQVAKNKMTSKIEKQTFETENIVKEKEVIKETKIKTAREQGEKEAKKWLDS